MQYLHTWLIFKTCLLNRYEKGTDSKMDAMGDQFTRRAMDASDQPYANRTEYVMGEIVFHNATWRLQKLQ